MPYLRRSVLLLALLACACAERPRRHVVLISMDTTRADHLGCYGDTRGITPHIDALAREGVVFADVTAPAPTTLASHTSLMTGSWPQTHGVVRNNFVVHKDNVMLAEVLGQAGFHTSAVLGSFALEQRFAFDQGFAHFDERFALEVSLEGHDQNQRRAAQVTDAVLRHLDEPGVAGEDLFLFVHYFDAHQPYDPPAPFDRGWPREGAPPRVAPAYAADIGRSVQAHQARLLGGKPLGIQHVITQGLPPQLVQDCDGAALPMDQRLARLYAGEVAYMDREIGRLLEGLEQRGIAKDALIVISADHGETFYEHGDFWNHGLWVYQTTTQVPLVLRFPDGRGSGRRVSTPVSTVDLAPTVYAWLGLEAPARTDGVSLLPALEGGAFERGPVFSQATQPGARWEPPAPGWGNIAKPRSVRMGSLKFVRAPYLGALEELYDLAADPGERTNLLAGAAPDPGVLDSARRLRAALDAWERPTPLLPSAKNDQQTEETLERLRALGYAGEDE